VSTITTNATLTITTEAALHLPAMSAEPLQSIGRNTNHLYSYFCPAAVSFAPLTASAGGRGVSYIVAVQPSVDGLNYAWTHRFLPDAGWTGGNQVTITVETRTDLDPTPVAVGWTTQWTGLSSGLTAATWGRGNHDATIPADATLVRVTYTAAQSFLPGHCIAVPSPGNVSAGAKASGFLPWDDDALAATGAGVNTEYVNRARFNALNILKDRPQVVGSLVQEYVASPFTNGRCVAPSAGLPNTQWMLIGRGRASLPGQLAANLSVTAIAAVTGGSTTGLIQVKTSTASVTLNATGQLETATLYVVTDGQDERAGVDFEVRVLATKPAGTQYHTYLQSLAILWRPGD
jgi:hypothetical protein